jgi:short subunit dehydrogenase-like uncharacterized protein
VTYRIVVFGATGHTGRLIAERLAAAGVAPLLVGRDAARTARVARDLGCLEHAVADARRPETLIPLVEQGSVLVSTVGPFSRWGEAALTAAMRRGVVYLDSSGEPAFISTVFRRDGDARHSGAALITAMGYDYVPGALAGALALRRAGPRAKRVEIGYFAPGRRASAGLSRGTRLSVAGALLAGSVAYRDGRLQTVPAGERLRRFRVDGSARPALSIGGAEHRGLPRLHSALEEVNVYAGWFGNATPCLRAGSLALSRMLSSATLRRRLAGIAERLADRPTNAVTDGAGDSLVIATAHERAGATLARVVLRGPEPYTFTAHLMAWAACTAACAGVAGTGALGPVEAFGLSSLQQGCAHAGLREVPAA